MTLKRIIRRAGFVAFYATATLFFLVFPLLFGLFLSSAGSRPQDRLLTQRPAPEIPVEDVAFTTDDGANLRGWWLPARPSRGAVVLSHGLFRSRQEMLPEAELLWRSGYSALLYDSRRHGQSQGRFFTLGYFEKYDVKAAVEEARRLAPEQPVVAWGVSMGAVSSLRAAAGWGQVAGVIAESPFHSLRQTTRHHIRTFFRVPGCPWGPEILWIMRLRTGLKAEEMELENTVLQMGKIPLLLVASSEDWRMSPESVRLLYERSRGEPRDYWVARAQHGRAFQEETAEYSRRVLQFLGSATHTQLR
ncbi:MAG: alpha/beta hydrolase [Acidobacteriota bacterium]